MEKKFVDYLNAIGINTVSLQSEVELRIEFFKRETCEDPEDIFVLDGCDYVTRFYSSLYLFSQNYIMECLNVFRQDILDHRYRISLVRNDIELIEIEKTLYDFREATDRSKLRIQIIFYFEKASICLSGTEENCDYLRDIYYKYFKPLLKS